MSVLAEIQNVNEGVQQPAKKAQKLDAINTLQVKLLSPHATLPKRGSANAAGYDLSRYTYQRFQDIVAWLSAELISVCLQFSRHRSASKRKSCCFD